MRLTKKSLKLVSFIFIVLALSMQNIFITFASPDTNTKKVQEFQKVFYDVFKESIAINQDAFVLKDFVIKKSTKVKAIYIDSVAGYTNSLGYFKFDLKTAKKINNQYELTLDEIKETTLFENVKTTTPGTEIEINLSENEGLGFFIKNEYNKFYSVKSLNSDKSSHTAKYKSTKNSKTTISLGFEDMPISSSDKDYNDVFFVIDLLNSTCSDVPDLEDVDDNVNATPPATVSPSPSTVVTTSGCTESTKPSQSPTVKPSNSPSVTTASTTSTVATTSTTVITQTTTPVASSLPKAGESNPLIYILLGLIITCSGAFLFFKHKQKS